MMAQARSPGFPSFLCPPSPRRTSGGSGICLDIGPGYSCWAVPELHRLPVQLVAVLLNLSVHRHETVQSAPNKIKIMAESWS